MLTNAERRVIAEHIIKMGLSPADVLEEEANLQGYYAWSEDLGGGWTGRKWVTWTQEQQAYISANTEVFDKWLREGE